MKTKIIVTLLLFAAALTSCDKGDDLSDIFRSHPWTLSFFYEGGKRTAPKNGDAYVMRFYDTTFSMTAGDGATITGNWAADNKERTLRCTNIRVNGGSISGDTIAMKAEKILKAARYYAGDSNWLQIQIQKHTYMQFHNK